MIIPALVSSALLLIVIFFVAIYKVLHFIISQILSWIKMMSKKDTFKLSTNTTTVEKSLISKITHTESLSFRLNDN